MRVRFFLVMTMATSVGAGAAIQACGGSSDSGSSGSPTAEAGPDTSITKDSSVADTNAPDVFDARPPCDPNKDILKDVPDASIADGASTTGACIACAEMHCSTEIDNCKKDCSRSETDKGCQDLGAAALSCYAMTQSLIKCAAPFFTAKGPTQMIGVALGTCVNKYCQDECGVPGDGGM
jgi:hypothetical protein